MIYVDAGLVQNSVREYLMIFENVVCFMSDKV